MYSKLKTNSDIGVKIKNLSNPSYGSISSNAFKQHLQDKGVHPDVISTLNGAGFFDKLVKGIKTTADFVIKNKDDIAKGIKTGVQVYNKGKEMYNAYKGGMLTDDTQHIITIGKGAKSIRDVARLFMSEINNLNISVETLIINNFSLLTMDIDLYDLKATNLPASLRQIIINVGKTTEDKTEINRAVEKLFPKLPYGCDIKINYGVETGGKLMAGKIKKSVKKGGTILAGKLNPEHRKKINKVGQYMKKGYSMKEAWALVKSENL